MPNDNWRAIPLADVQSLRGEQIVRLTEKESDQ